ncbi:MAG: flavodoxin [Clostridia bacterium]|nr:flavodoxin [Clostridia bacterium]
MSKTIVIYKTKYGSTKTYAHWIAEELGCGAVNAKDIKIDDLSQYDTVIYGGGLYAEIINGVTLITKNMEKLSGKKIIIYTTGITPLDVRAYYDGEVLEKNFKNGVPENVKIFNFLGKMKMDELTLVHRAALKSLKKIMSAKENPSDMIKLLIELCDADGDFCDRTQIRELCEYAKS